MMLALRCIWSLAVAWLSHWWATRSLRKAASAGEAAKVREAYADRDNAALRAENDALKHQLEEKRDEPVPTSYDGNSHALAGWLRRKNNTADR